MYYGRRITLTRKNKTDPHNTIINFIYDLASTEAYLIVFEQLSSMPGFVHTTTSHMETADDLASVTQTVFDSEEHALAYTSSPSTNSLLEYLITLANDANIDIKVEDGKINTLHI
jgi:antibiotic biosynthesis monooxygenase (ABM) superfamily enzyme